MKALSDETLVALAVLAEHNAASPDVIPALVAEVQRHRAVMTEVEALAAEWSRLGGGVVIDVREEVLNPLAAVLTAARTEAT